MSASLVAFDTIKKKQRCNVDFSEATSRVEKP